MAFVILVFFLIRWNHSFEPIHNENSSIIVLILSMTNFRERCFCLVLFCFDRRDWHWDDDVWLWLSEL